MKMFRDELLDLNDILNYIKLAPDESAATTSVVSTSGDGLPVPRYQKSAIHKPHLALLADMAVVPTRCCVMTSICFGLLNVPGRPFSSAISVDTVSWILASSHQGCGGRLLAVCCNTPYRHCLQLRGTRIAFVGDVANAGCVLCRRRQRRAIMARWWR